MCCCMFFFSEGTLSCCVVFYGVEGPGHKGKFGVMDMCQSEEFDRNSRKDNKKHLLIQFYFVGYSIIP